jgi:hypothetical protein
VHTYNLLRSIPPWQVTRVDQLVFITRAESPTEKEWR